MHLNTAKKCQETEKYYLQQFQLSCLGQFSYYLESDKKALIIDPIREIDQYMQLLEKRGAQLQYVILTHIHADFVAGHLDLQKKTGAQILLGENAQTAYPIRIVKDEEIIPLGQVSIRTLHTPGHTLESSSFVLVVDGRDHCVFSGDALFIQEVGRPDLAVKKNEITKEQLASHLYRSLRQKLMKLADDVILYPGHGAGSSCGKSIGAGTFCTIGNQKKDNYALQDMSEDEFVKINTDLPSPPQYFFHDVKLNRAGPSDTESVRKQVLKSLNYQQFEQLISEGTIVIDSREDISAGLIVGAINVSFTANFASFVGALFKPETSIVIVADVGREEFTIDRLLRIGYENIQGYLEGGFQNYLKNNKHNVVANIVGVEEFLDCKDNSSVFVDVRNGPEFKSSGIIKGAIMAPLPAFENHISEFPRDKTLRIYCRSGARAKTAMTLLMKHGFSNFVIMQNLGFEHLQKKGVEIQQI